MMAVRGTAPGKWLSRRLVWCAIAAALVLAPAALGRSSALVMAVPAAATAFTAMMRWPWGRVPLAAAASAVCLLSLTADLVFRGPQGYVVLWALVEFPALLILAGRVIRRAPDRQAATVGPLVASAVVLLPVRFLFAAPAADVQAVALTCSLSLLPAAGAIGIGLYFRTLDNRRARAVLEALREQRLQVAADLHDFVAHELTGIVLEVQAARLDAYEPAQFGELLGRLEASGLRALDSMDRTVQTLRGPGERDAPPTRVYGLGDLTELVGRFAESTDGGALAELRVEPDLAGTLPRGTEDTAHRVVLEALTNIRRHAAGARGVTVTVVRAPAGTPAVEVTVTDDGNGTTSPPILRRGAGGTGLPELRARAEALGGTLTWGPHKTGWRVRAILPG
ncbi:sensor histidine kinase [Streptosporangium lutulentum]|uniref:histidine kinase n=1 Tax=Streptosporangium lutulentum TaxID=1461250 RepID=A0ABT9Q545_9ACTN|nr:histidine kinase [Streptosporangium lutulentum]MDP9841862.1 signal transduction histidine kinase [Streptosporangium lutulentum]